MGFSLEMPTNVIEVLVSILSWGLILYFVYFIYKNQEVKPKVWKACIVTLIGIFSFSFNFPVFTTIIKVPILPLGVWIIYFYARNRIGAWDKYRSYAWLGFIANFIFIVTALLTVFLHNLVFPKNELTTYISNHENAAVNILHSSAEEAMLDKDSFEQLFPTFKEAPIESVEWYSEMVIGKEPHEIQEKFPYQLLGTTSKRGSGLLTMIYVEKDGKGLLIDSSEQQRYFITEESILKGGYSE